MASHELWIHLHVLPRYQEFLAHATWRFLNLYLIHPALYISFFLIMSFLTSWWELFGTQMEKRILRLHPFPFVCSTFLIFYFIFYFLKQFSNLNKFWSYYFPLTNPFISSPHPYPSNIKLFLKKQTTKTISAQQIKQSNHTLNKTN